MLAVLDQKEIDVMWPKMKELYDILDGWNVANTILDEQIAKIEFIKEDEYQTLIGVNYRINVFKDDSSNFVFADNITKDRFKELCDKINIEREIEFTVRKFPNRKESPKVVIDLGNDYLRRAADLFELLKIK